MASTEGSDREAGMLEAARLMQWIPTNDFFDHSGVEALRALGVRDLISREDYDEFTLERRSMVGAIHPDDAAVALIPDHVSGSGRLSKHE